jgi:hypothetical protein
MSKSSFVCKKCNYMWSPRKAITRYERQCPKCNSSDLNVGSPASQSQNNQANAPAVTNTISTARTNLPSVIFDLVGVTGAVSADNAIHRAFELYRKLYLYKVKYGLESVEAVFSFLEREASVGNKRALEAEKRLKDLLDNPENIFLQTPWADLTPVDWYEDEKKKGYDGSFLDFINRVVERFYADRGLKLPDNKD